MVEIFLIFLTHPRLGEAWLMMAGSGGAPMRVFVLQRGNTGEECIAGSRSLTCANSHMITKITKAM